MAEPVIQTDLLENELDAGLAAAFGAESTDTVITLATVPEWRTWLCTRLGRAAATPNTVSSELRLWCETWRTHARELRNELEDEDLDGGDGYHLEWRAAADVAAAFAQLATEVDAGDWLRETNELVTCLERFCSVRSNLVSLP